MVTRRFVTGVTTGMGAAVSVAMRVVWTVLVASSVTVSDAVRVTAAAVTVLAATDAGILRHEQANDTRHDEYVVGRKAG